jgi:dTDP-4-dehydrorhamnose reductase
VDRCETNRELAWSINAEGTGNVAEACRKIGAKLIYVSTDYVFDGNKGMYKEEDEPKPVNYYGLSKLRGEELVKKTCDAFVVARTSVLYGWHPSKRNYATWIMDSLKNRKRINVVTDHYNSPTYADDLAETISRVIERDVNGILHVSGKDRVSRYDFAMEIAEVFGLDASLVTPVKMADLKAWVARRPRDSSLDVGKAENELGIRFPKVTESLIRMKRTQS